MSEVSSIRVMGKNVASQRVEESSIPKEFLRILLCDENGDAIDIGGSSVTSFADNEFEIYGSDDNTKKMSFDVDSEVSAGEESVVKVPDLDGTMALQVNWSTTESVYPLATYKGETLYNKIVDFGAGSNNASKTVAHGISNLDYVFDYWFMGIVSGGGRWRYFGGEVRTSSTEDGRKLFFEVDGTNVKMESDANLSNWDLETYLIYTKSA